MNPVVDTIVIGGGQAGLAMAWQLKQQNHRFLVLDAGPAIGHSWRSRWDSLVLFTPAQYDALPGMEFPASADTYPTKDQVADYLRDYAAAFDLPVQLNRRVTGLRRAGELFEVETAASRSSAAATRACRSPPNWPGPGRWSLRSARASRRCPNACWAATCSGGSPAAGC